MKTAVISSYPPEKCGVAVFTAQAVSRLRAAGEQVSVLTWGEGEGDFRISGRPRGSRVLEFLPACRGMDRVIFHYLPDFFVDGRTPWSQVASRLALHRFFRRAPGLEVFMHDPPWYPPYEELSARGRVLWALDRRQFAAAPAITFHNEIAIDIFCRRFRLPRERMRTATHGSDFVANYQGSREEARRELGLGEGPIFVSLGFISPRKGYELALEAMRMTPDTPCEYHIVGEPHPAGGEADRHYVESLRELAAKDSRVRLNVRFVDDVDFDRWLRAADAVLIPSRFASSSSVLARAHLMGVPSITTDEPGLMAEFQPGDRAIADAGELAAMLRKWPA